MRDLGPATAKAVGYIRTLRPERVVPLFVGDPETFEDAAERWSGVAPRLGSLQQLRVQDGRPTKALRARLRSIRKDGQGFVTVVLAEEIASRSLLRQLGHRWGFWLKVWLSFEVGIVVTDVPLLPGDGVSMNTRPVEGIRHVVLIPVSGVHAATVEAVSYALFLEAAEIEAVYLSTDRGDEQELASAWIDWRMGIRLGIVDAPFRDLSEPMLEEVRRHTARDGTIVTVVLPELVVAHWWEQLCTGRAPVLQAPAPLRAGGGRHERPVPHLSRRPEPADRPRSRDGSSLTRRRAPVRVGRGGAAQW